MANYEITSNEEQENVSHTIKLIVEKDKVNEEAISQILDKINDDKKYKVSIVYKSDNGLIDYIIINELGE